MNQIIRVPFDLSFSLQGPYSRRVRRLQPRLHLRHHLQHHHTHRQNRPRLITGFFHDVIIYES